MEEDEKIASIERRIKFIRERISVHPENRKKLEIGISRIENEARERRKEIRERYAKREKYFTLRSEEGYRREIADLEKRIERVTKNNAFDSKILERYSKN